MASARTGRLAARGQGRILADDVLQLRKRVALLLVFICFTALRFTRQVAGNTMPHKN
jgi:hypothetical protein